MQKLARTAGIWAAVILSLTFVSLYWTSDGPQSPIKSANEGQSSTANFKFKRKPHKGQSYAKPASMEDYSRHPDKWIFDGFMINGSNYCPSSGGKIELLVLIHSSADHFKFRDILRKYRPHWARLVFFLGLRDNPALQQGIMSEASQNNDIVQGNFHDSYRNLTRKHIMALTWARRFCNNSDLILKMDDDIFVNWPLLHDLINYRYPKSSNDSLVTRVGYKVVAGFHQAQMPVIRDHASKWFVNHEEFISDYYPDFVSGWAYLTSQETVFFLLNQVPQNQPWLWVDDVYVTGILRRSVGDVFVDNCNKWFNLDVYFLVEWISRMKKHRDLTTHAKPLAWRYVFSNTNGDAGLLQEASELNTMCSSHGTSKRKTNESIDVNYEYTQCKCCYPNRKNLKYGAFHVREQALSPSSKTGHAKSFKL